MRLSTLALAFVGGLAPAFLGCGGAGEAVKHNNAGVALGNQGQWREAIAEFDEAIRLNPQYTAAYTNRGESYRRLGQHQRAIQDLDEAIRLDPKYAVAHANSAVAYMLLSRNAAPNRDGKRVPACGPLATKATDQ